AAGPWPAPRGRGARSCGASERGETVDPHREAYRRHRLRGAEPGEQSVVAPAGDQLAAHLAARVVQLEHHAGVVIESAPEAGGETDAFDVDAARGEEAGTALEEVERGREREPGIRCERAQFGQRLVRIAADGEEAFDQGARRARQRAAGA